MARLNLLCGGVLVALGVIAGFEALRVRDDWLGAKLMPAVLSVALLALGMSHCLKSIVASDADVPPAPGRRVVAVLGALILFVAMLPQIGFLLATTLFLLALLRLLGGFPWAKSVALSGAIALGSHVVFTLWLRMPFPRGPWGF